MVDKHFKPLFLNRVGMPLGTSCGCQRVGSSAALHCWEMRGREVTCLSAVLPACSSCNQIRPINTQFWRGTAGNLNDKVHSSILAVFRPYFGRTHGPLLVSSSDLDQLECRLERRHHAGANKFQSGLGSIAVQIVPSTLQRLISDRCSANVPSLSQPQSSKTSAVHVVEIRL